MPTLTNTAIRTADPASDVAAGTSTVRPSGGDILRVLFVDDEPAILIGINRLLRARKWNWEIEMAVGGQAALAVLAARTFDVIVTDMRMPTVDGLDLLTQVARSYPDMGRIVLSGYAEPEAVKLALTVAQRFLSKPCNAETLTAAITDVASGRATDAS